MAEKKITRKVISKAAPAEKVSKEEIKTSDSVGTKAEETSPALERYGAGRTKRACFFCQSKTNPSYTDMSILRRFVTDRAKIVAKTRSNLCSKHQRMATRQIKYARHLSLLPFSPKV